MFSSFFNRSVDDVEERVFTNIGDIVANTNKNYKIEKRVIDDSDDDSEIVDITDTIGVDDNADNEEEDGEEDADGEEGEDEDEDGEDEEDEDGEEGEDEDGEEGEGYEEDEEYSIQTSDISETEYDSVIQSVIKQLKDRSKIGFAKYGTNLDREDLTFLQWIQHAQEENMDSILYLEKIKQLQCSGNKTIIFRQKYRDDIRDFVIIVLTICFMISAISNVVISSK